jgi:hypothetical protein
MRLIKQKIDKERVALGVAGSLEEISGIMLSLLNYGVITSNEHKHHKFIGLHLGAPDTFQYVFIEESSLLAWLQYRLSLRFDIDRLESGPLQAYLAGKASATMAEIADERFLDCHFLDTGEEYFRPERIAQAKAEIAEQAETYARELAAH